jgi:hypothetical protein
MSLAPTPCSSSLEKINLRDKSSMDSIQEEKVTSADAAMAEQGVSQTMDDPSLPPVDRGAQAWLFLAGCYVMEMPVFGT